MNIKGCGQSQFAGIKPQGPASNQAALPEGERPISALCSHVHFLQMRGQPAQTKTQRKEWKQWRDIRPAPFSPFPPAYQQQRCRQRARHGFAQQCGDKQTDCQRIPSPRPDFRLRGFVMPGPSGKPQIAKRRRQIKDAGQHILAFRNPGDGFHFDRMGCKNGRRQPCTRKLQLAQ